MFKLAAEIRSQMNMDSDMEKHSMMSNDEDPSVRKIMTILGPISPLADELKGCCLASEHLFYDP
jgi:hypothetical protein